MASSTNNDNSNKIISTKQYLNFVGSIDEFHSNVIMKKRGVDFIILIVNVYVISCNLVNVFADEGMFICIYIYSLYSYHLLNCIDIGGEKIHYKI